ncbi:nucleic-acid-binding protein from transposon X-element [Trichonephila clavipes]|nr:nucleic-acid-binding protein from transposon X-element [Trichonephila clavipes]
MKLIINKFPNLRNRIVGDVVKMFSNDHEERRSLIQFLKTDLDLEFYVIDVKKDKPIKAVIKGLPNSSKADDITSDLADVGFKIESCTQLASKRTKKPLPFFLIILPRNAHNSKIFDLTHLSYLQVRVEGYLVRGITQCFNCNNFYHTAANCHMQPRCLKCGRNHATRNCLIKERQENPFCINCQDYGHSACYTKCPKFPQPKKGTPFGDPKKKRNFASKWIKEGISFANVVSGEVPNQIPIDDKKEDYPHGFLSQDSNNTSDLTQKLLGAVNTRRYPRVENRVWSDQEDHEERGSKDRAAALVDLTVTRSTVREDVVVAIVPQTISRRLAEANLKSKRHFRALPLIP